MKYVSLLKLSSKDSLKQENLHQADVKSTSVNLKTDCSTKYRVPEESLAFAKVNKLLLQTDTGRTQEFDGLIENYQIPEFCISPDDTLDNESGAQSKLRGVLSDRGVAMPAEWGTSHGAGGPGTKCSPLQS